MIGTFSVAELPAQWRQHQPSVGPSYHVLHVGGERVAWVGRSLLSPHQYYILSKYAPIPEGHYYDSVETAKTAAEGHVRVWLNSLAKDSSAVLILVVTDSVEKNSEEKNHVKGH